MQQQKEQARKKTLLVFNCHEAWVYQLGVLTNQPGMSRYGRYRATADCLLCRKLSSQTRPPTGWASRGEG